MYEVTVGGPRDPGAKPQTLNPKTCSLRRHSSYSGTPRMLP